MCVDNMYLIFKIGMKNVPTHNQFDYTPVISVWIQNYTITHSPLSQNTLDLLRVFCEYQVLGGIGINRGYEVKLSPMDLLTIFGLS